MHISFRDVSKVYRSRKGGDVAALDGISLDIARGTFVSLVGPSGCGKTTVLDLLLGVQRPTSGSIHVETRRGTKSQETPREQRPGVVLQTPTLLPWRTVEQNVAFPAECGKPRGHLDGAERQRRISELLELVHIPGFATKYPWELSGGMQQRVAIARALFLDTDLMCFDEPFSALDEFTREALNLELQKIWADRSFTAVFVTHNIQEAVLLADRVIVLAPRPGRIVADIDVDLPRPRTPECYGDPAFGDLIGAVRTALRGNLHEAVL